MRCATTSVRGGHRTPSGHVGLNDRVVGQNPSFPPPKSLDSPTSFPFLSFLSFPFTGLGRQPATSTATQAFRSFWLPNPGRRPTRWRLRRGGSLARADLMQLCAPKSPAPERLPAAVLVGGFGSFGWKGFCFFGDIQRTDGKEVA